MTDQLNKNSNEMSSRTDGQVCVQCNNRCGAKESTRWLVGKNEQIPSGINM